MAMRVSLKELIQSSIVLQYHLPHDIADKHISCSCISTEKDYCLHQNGTNIDIANIIYNGIVEYAYSDNEIDLTQLDKLQIRALLSKLKFDPSASESIQLGYGFQGEVMLHLLLSHFFHAEKALARGYLYSALENAETKGYDSYLIILTKLFLILTSIGILLRWKTTMNILSRRVEFDKLLINGELTH